MKPELSYVILKFIELLVFTIFGYILSKTTTNQDYWRKSIIPILTYTLIEGLRFGRMVDWNMYYFRYVDIGQGITTESYEPVFTLLIKVCYSIGLPYPAFILLQCFLLIFSIFLFLRHYKRYLTYALPILIYVIAMNENYIRWYMAFSFILLSINSLIASNRNYAIVWAICASLTHSGIILFLPILFFAKYVNNIKLSPKILLIIFLLTCFVFTLSNLSFLISISNFIISKGLGGFSSIITKYLYEIENLINGDFGGVGASDRSIFGRLRFFISWAPLIWYGQKYMQEIKWGNFIYNLFAVGAICYPLFTLIEIFDRYAFSLMFFSVIVAGVLFYNIFTSKIKQKLAIVIICFMSFIMQYSVSYTDVFNMRYTLGHETPFVWDANGKKFIPYWVNWGKNR